MKSLGDGVFHDSTGIYIRKPPQQPVRRIFRVVSEATGDGIYNCFEQVLDATEWSDTAGDNKFNDLNSVSIEVLNLAEFNPEATYVAELAANDMITAWQMSDDEAGLRWVGLPLSKTTGLANSVRKAYCKTAAGAATTIVAFLDTDTTGTEITVACSIAGGGNLNSAIPRLTDGRLIFVTNLSETWYCTTVFQATEDCVCS